mmetsp:Transcript_51071/g.110841  ORF Transcript_51071/g.110841 Transcript_51071/m.110841 type:complete len:815 (-) Transcript_51071:284-2728(-)
MPLATSAWVTFAGIGLAFLRPTSGNWLLQCSSCVDQAFFGDESLKENVEDANIELLHAQIRKLRLREFDHKEDEFYNKFFSKRQLGILTSEVQPIMPSAVARLSERRWTSAKGISNMTKNVMLLRDSHLLMASVASLQVVGRTAERLEAAVDKLNKEMLEVWEEQNDSRRKREEMLEQMVRIIAKVEVLQHALSKTEEGFVRIDGDLRNFKAAQEEISDALQRGLEDVRNRTLAQDASIASFQDAFRAAVDREARADLVEKRKEAEAAVEVALVRRSIEKVRWEEEQKTIKMRGEDQRRSEDHSSKLHQDRVAHELAQKKLADLEIMQQQEESNIRQEEARVKGETELLKLKLLSEEKRAELGVQQAIEAAKVEQEAKLRDKRENEDVNLRHLKAEMLEKRQQTVEAIRATAEIIHSWISSLFGNPNHLLLAIGSVVATAAGLYVSREMAILLREQLNKRLGRPSLVRKTDRRGSLQQAWIGLLRFLRLRPPHGSEFSDVVLHPRLHQQVMRLADATRSAKRRHMPLQHVMFYGPPGTGKTMVAQRFAEFSGLEYAIMSGGDVAPLEEQAVTELHKLFSWVHRSRRGVLLFIDEADAFLASRKRGNMSESLRNALTTMLYHTGTPSSQFMMVLATNRPGDLDSAVLDRVDESVEFGLPDVDARMGMVRMYFDMYITKPLGIKILKAEDSTAGLLVDRAKQQGRFARCSCSRKQRSETPKGVPLKADDLTDEESLAEVARRIAGFSGREISKMFTSLQTHVLYNAQRAELSRFMPKGLLFEVVDAKALEHHRTGEFQVSGYNYEHTENGKMKPAA